MTSSNRTDSTIEIQLTKGHVAVVDTADADLAAYRWHAHLPGPYARRFIGTKPSIERLYMHRVIMARIAGRPLARHDIVDHCDGNPLNNRRSNLRLVTKAQNGLNRGPTRTNKFGLKGVSVVGNRYRATIKHEGQQIHLGSFGTPEEAHAAYCQAAHKFHGEFANVG